jgi:MFS family permease
VLLGSLQLARLSQWWGNHRLTVVGALLLSSYPLLTAFTPGLGLYLVTSLIGGVAWSMVGGSLGNYLLEQIPPTDRPAYLAWYNLALNAAILLGSLSGSLLAEVFTLSEALLVAFVLRLAAGLALWQWR